VVEGGIAFVTATLQLRSLLCNEPATAFGDDIEIFVNDISAGPEFPIDKGQFRDLSAFRTDFDGQAVIDFVEDGTLGARMTIDEALAGKGVQVRDVQIKDDGRYQFSFEVIPGLVSDQTHRAENVVLAPPIMTFSVFLDPSDRNAITVTVTQIPPAITGFLRAFLQVRQAPARPFPDQFALQVIAVDSASMVFRIKRLDAAGGWGQRLQIQVLLTGG